MCVCILFGRVIIIIYPVICLLRLAPPVIPLRVVVQATGDVSNLLYLFVFAIFLFSFLLYNWLGYYSYYVWRCYATKVTTDVVMPGTLLFIFLLSRNSRVIVQHE